ncbi:MAG: hypothetical protein V1816_04410 [Pseudomonadota bacterium]
MTEKHLGQSSFAVEPPAGERELDRELLALSGVLSGLPGEEPPLELLTGVMSRLGPRKVSRVRKALLWLRSPLAVTVTPLRAAPWGMAAAALLAALWFSNPSGPPALDSRFASVTSDPGVNVVLSLDLSGASSAAVIGNFNSWSPTGFEMRWDEKERRWNLPLNLKKGRYEYAFLVDGKHLVPDPAALLSRDDGFGSRNSVLIVENGGGNEKI